LTRQASLQMAAFYFGMVSCLCFWRMTRSGEFCVRACVCVICHVISVRVIIKSCFNLMLRFFAGAFCWKNALDGRGYSLT
jgi:hypothetical protein